MSIIWNKDTVYPKLFGEFSCIYALENRKNGKVYIGRAEKYTPRLSAHYYTLKKGTHSNVEMQRDFDEGHDFEYICRQMIFEDVVEINP